MALTAYRPERPEVIRDTDVEKGLIAAFARREAFLAQRAP